MDAHDIRLILLALGAIGVLVLLITRLKVNPFIALLASALLLGFGAGMKPLEIVRHFQEGLGATLSSTAGIIALGVMLGKFMAESGGAGVLAVRFNQFFGPQRAVWCISVLAVVVGLTTWFAVGLLLLLPVLVTLTRESGRPFLLLAIPLVSFLSVMHGLTPPHPGPVVAVDKLGADTGRVLLWGFAIGVPAGVLAGPLFARWAVKRLQAPAPEMTATHVAENRRTPGFGLTLFTMLLPVMLMLAATVAVLTLPPGHGVREAVTFIGSPLIALAVAVVFALWSFGARCGYDRPQMLRFTEQSISGIGMMLLVVGGGGGFARVLREAGVAGSLGDMAQVWGLTPLVYAWMVAAFIRVATGSATVAITAAAEFLVPLLPGMHGVNRELLVIAIGCGSLFCSHLNDGGFWIVKESFGLTVGQTLRTWTVTETIVGIAGLLLTLLADVIWRAVAG